MRYLWKVVLITTTVLVTLYSFAKEKFRCGEYEIKGVIRLVGGKSVLKLYEGSMSETILNLDPSLQDKALVHLDSPVTLRGMIKNPIEKYQGSVAAVAGGIENSIRPRASDPLYPKLDSSLKLISASACGKSAKKSRH